MILSEIISFPFKRGCSHNLCIWTEYINSNLLSYLCGWPWCGFIMLPTIHIFSIQGSMGLNGTKMNRTAKENEDKRKIRLNKWHKSQEGKNTNIHTQSKANKQRKKNKTRKCKTSFPLTLPRKRWILVQFQVKQYHYLDSSITKNNTQTSQSERKSTHRWVKQWYLSVCDTLPQHRPLL